MSDAEKVIFLEDENDALLAKIKELERTLQNLKTPVYD